MHKDDTLHICDTESVWSPNKVGCVFPAVVVSILPHAELGRNTTIGKPHPTLKLVVKRKPEFCYTFSGF